MSKFREYLETVKKINQKYPQQSADQEEGAEILDGDRKDKDIDLLAKEFCDCDKPEQKDTQIKKFIAEAKKRGYKEDDILLGIERGWKPSAEQLQSKYLCFVRGNKKSEIDHESLIDDSLLKRYLNTVQDKKK